MMAIRIKVNIPVIVANHPIFVERVQPAREIIIMRENIPMIKVTAPISLGRIRSRESTSKGNPPVVSIRILVMEKILMINELEAIMAAFIIRFDHLPAESETRKFAIVAIENPPSRELIRMS
jgi:hypothetical protein